MVKRITDKVWILKEEDGDGYLEGFAGAFKSPQSAMKFAEKRWVRNDLVLIPSTGLDKDYNEIALKDCYDISFKNPGRDYFICIYRVELEEIQ